jgi:hypothetical protein
LGLTVDASTARKIAFFQSGPSTYDLVTQTPLDPVKSSRLLEVLNTGNFILWFRQLLGSRQVKVEKVLHGHGCEKFRDNNPSRLFALLKAIEAGETVVCTIGRFIPLSVLTKRIRESTAAREAGERPSIKINEMIRTGQLQWEEQRYPGGRLHGYYMPAQETVAPTHLSIVQAPPAEGVDEQHEAQKQLHIVEENTSSISNLPTLRNTKRYIPPEMRHHG